ncbi:PIG-L family deacetylase [Candidatus Micrarchaeota archaeon]|nr:PIG-L family deacetylase [Candidatus Micrarchaeota archaeon]
MKKILVVAAHPDDETLGAGATMARHIKEGDSVSVIILGTGLASRNEDKNSDISREMLKLREDSKKALGELGVKEVEFFDFPDNRFDSVDLLEIVKTIEKVIDRKKPEIIYTHHWGDMNIDHRMTFSAVMTATRPMLSCSVKKILCFEVTSSSEWNAQNPNNAFMPNYFVDVSQTLKKKLDALAHYKGEMREYPHPRSTEGNEYLARMRGLTISTKAAEAFVLVRELVR